MKNIFALSLSLLLIPISKNDCENNVYVSENGISITTAEVSANTAIVKVNVELANDDDEANEATIKVELLENGQFLTSKYTNTYLSPEGKTVANFSFDIKNPKLYSPDNPCPYEAKVTVTPLIGSPVFDASQKSFSIKYLP